MRIQKGGQESENRQAVLIIVRWLSGGCQLVVRQLTCGCQAVLRHLSASCFVVVIQLLGDCWVVVKRLSGSCHPTLCGLEDLHYIVSNHLDKEHQLSGWFENINFKLHKIVSFTSQLTRDSHFGKMSHPPVCLFSRPFQNRARVHFLYLGKS